MLIDISYFTEGPRHIQNASLSNMPTMEAQSVNKSIKGYIDFYISPFLNNMVGYELAYQVEQRLFAIDDGNVDVVPLDTLIENMKESYADFVFFNMMKNVNTQPTVTGVVRLKSANEYADPKELLVSTWNRMVESNERFIEWVLSEECPYKVKIKKTMLTPINVLNI